MRMLSVAAVAAVFMAAPVAAQLPQASATSLGLGHNTTASARGFAAIAANPAALAHPSGPGLSLNIPAVQAHLGLGPVTLSDLAGFSGRVIPFDTRVEWLNRVSASGLQSGAATASVTPLALTVGTIGVQLSTVVGGATALSPGAAELVLFGNAGRTGAAEDFALDGSVIDAFALSTAAVGLGLEVSTGLYVGATGTYSVGHGVVMARDAGSFFQSDPLELQLDFPAIVPRTENPVYDHGSGVGLNLGVLYEEQGLSIGATIENVMNTFEWRTTDLSYVPATAIFDLDGGETNFDEMSAEQAPAVILDQLAELTLEPALAVGVELRPSELLSLTADLKKRTGGLALGPDFHAGVGAEVRALSFLPLRAHVVKVTGGMQVGGGASLVLGPVNITGAAAVRTDAQENSILGAFALSFGSH